jgi:hypothetical protein
MLDDMCSFFGFLAVSFTLSISVEMIYALSRAVIGGCCGFGCLHTKGSKVYFSFFNLPVLFGAVVTSLPVLAHEYDRRSRDSIVLNAM